MTMNKLKALWKDRKNQSQYVSWLIQYVKPYWWKISLLMLVGLSSTGISLVMVHISKEIIDYASAGVEFIWLVAIYIALSLVTILISGISSVLSTVLQEKFSFGIRKQIYEKIVKSHWMDVKRYHTGDLMTRLTSDAGNISNGIAVTIPSIIQLGIELLLVFAVLFYYSPLLAIFAMLVTPVAAVASWWLGRKLKRMQIKTQEAEARYSSFLQESMANLLIVKAFSNEEHSVEKLAHLRDNYFHWVFKKTKVSVAGSTVMSLSFQLGYIVAFTYGAIQISTKVITYGTMSMFLTLVNRVQSPVMSLAHKIPQVVSILASASRIMEIQQLPTEEKCDEQLTAKNVGVKVEHLTFGYAEDAVLEDVTMDIRPGEFVAIIGESGIGKTTLVRILMSFMSNVQGMISFYNEAGEQEMANAGTRNYISYVPQGNTLFSGSIRENILMGKLDASEEEIWEALKLSSGFEFVKGLPKGLDTVIGERGHGLSEGQAQRIAIARAFIRKAPFLVLDEATSALDEQTELKVIEGLQQLEPRPTCLVITHRKSILAYCDREITIESKRVSE